MTLRDQTDRFDRPASETEPSLEQRAYEAVLGWLVKGYGKPGQPIPLREFARALGMSRTPLRAALGRLQEQGIVSYSPRFGFMANAPSASDLHELFDIRTMCEVHALRKYFRQEHPDVPAQLMDLADDTWRIADVEPATGELAQAFWDADNRFHRSLVALAGNQRLMAWWDLLHVNIHIQRAGWRSPLTSERFRRSASEHLQIVEAMASGDVQYACHVLEAHLTRVRDQTIRFMTIPD